jgi:hypothetical protein
VSRQRQQQLEHEKVLVKNTTLYVGPFGGVELVRLSGGVDPTSSQRLAS